MNDTVDLLSFTFLRVIGGKSLSTLKRPSLKGVEELLIFPSEKKICGKKRDAKVSHLLFAQILEISFVFLSSTEVINMYVKEPLYALNAYQMGLHSDVYLHLFFSAWNSRLFALVSLFKVSCATS